MAEPKVVLTVEDSPIVRQLVRDALETRGLRVLEAETLELGASLFSQRKPDLVILDLELPDGDGVDLCRKIRAHAELAATPVIMLTGKSALKDKAAGIGAGADQYLVKPLRAEEFLLWVDALLRRKELFAGNHDRLEVGPLLIDVKARLVRFGDELIEDLTAREFDLLYYLVKHRPKVISRDAVLKEAWKTIAVDNLVDAYVSRLRRKLPSALSDRLQTLPGKGFRFLYTPEAIG
jgi:DNA-binding response OmpR family regulator